MQAVLLEFKVKFPCAQPYCWALPGDHDFSRELVAGLDLLWPGDMGSSVDTPNLGVNLHEVPSLPESS